MQICLQKEANLQINLLVFFEPLELYEEMCLIFAWLMLTHVFPMTTAKEQDFFFSTLGE